VCASDFVHWFDRVTTQAGQKTESARHIITVARLVYISPTLINVYHTFYWKESAESMFHLTFIRRPSGPFITHKKINGVFFFFLNYYFKSAPFCARVQTMLWPATFCVRHISSLQKPIIIQFTL
jgi:hypothetical protein